MDHLSLVILMDPIEDINPKKDSSLAMLLAAQKKGWDIDYMLQSDLFWHDGEAFAQVRRMEVFDRQTDWFKLQEPIAVPLTTFDILLMRKDPPFDMDYIYSTYLLEQAESQGVLVLNHPASLRDFNEKLSTLWFPECCAPMCVSADMERIKAFIHQQGDVVVKPLDGMGGESIFRIRKEDPNTGVILEMMTKRGRRLIMAQRFIKEIEQGDKRILLIDGEPVDYALARIPAKGETRGNLAAGGKGVAVPLSDRDRWICQQVGPTLKDKGLIFVGLDVIGDYLTEINVTSPTCIRELDRAHNLDIAGQLMDVLEQKVKAIKR